MGALSVSSETPLNFSQLKKKIKYQLIFDWIPINRTSSKGPNLGCQRLTGSALSPSHSFYLGEKTWDSGWRALIAFNRCGEVKWPIQVHTVNPESRPKLKLRPARGRMRNLGPSTGFLVGFPHLLLPQSWEGKRNLGFPLSELPTTSHTSGSFLHRKSELLWARSTSTPCLSPTPILATS